MIMIAIKALKVAKYALYLVLYKNNDLETLCFGQKYYPLYNQSRILGWRDQLTRLFFLFNENALSKILWACNT